MSSFVGPKAGDYTYREGLEHKCKRDILLGRRRLSEDKTWKRIRPRPTKTNFVGSYYLCKGELKKEENVVKCRLFREGGKVLCRVG